MDKIKAAELITRCHDVLLRAESLASSHRFNANESTMNGSIVDDEERFNASLNLLYRYSAEYELIVAPEIRSIILDALELRPKLV